LSNSTGEKTRPTRIENRDHHTPRTYTTTEKRHTQKIQIKGQITTTETEGKFGWKGNDQLQTREGENTTQTRNKNKEGKNRKSQTQAKGNGQKKIVTPLHRDCPKERCRGIYEGKEN